MGLLPWIKNWGFAQNRAYFLSSPDGTTAHIPFPDDLAPYPNYLIPRREFVHAQRVLANARRISPVVGYPYRDDAENVTPYADNVMLMGDAAGAGHPMTGEGIGPAMVSAELAARYAIEALERGDLSSSGLAGYGDLFHAEFDGLHRIARLARNALSYPLLVDRTVSRCSHDPFFAKQLAGILAGIVSPRAMLSTGMLVRVALG